MRDRPATRHRSPGLGQRLMESRPVVHIYESRLWRRNPIVARIFGLAVEEELAAILEAARLDGSHRVLDLACGPGLHTRPIARRLVKGRIVGLDLSRPMLDQARENARREHLSNLDLVRASALALPFADGVFDVVNCCGALHLFPDADLALREVARVLARGGRFTVAAFRREETPAGRRVAGLRRRLFDVASYTEAELQQRSTRAGLTGFRCHFENGPWLVGSAEKA